MKGETLTPRRQNANWGNVLKCCFLPFEIMDGPKANQLIKGLESITSWFKVGLAMRLFLLMRIDAHQMRINAHKPHQ